MGSGQQLGPFLQMGRECVVRSQLLAQGCPLCQQRLIERHNPPVGVRHPHSALLLGKAHLGGLGQHG